MIDNGTENIKVGYGDQLFPTILHNSNLISDFNFRDVDFLKEAMESRGLDFKKFMNKNKGDIQNIKNQSEIFS